MLLGTLLKFLHFLKCKYRSLGKWPIKQDNSLIRVSPRSSLHRFSIFFWILGNFSKFEQLSRNNSSRASQHSMLVGSSLIPLSDNRSVFKCLIFTKKISGNFSNFEHFERLRVSRDIKDPMLLGNSLIPLSLKLSSLKNFISKNVRIDEWSLLKLTQPSRLSFSNFGILENFGILMSCCELLRSMNFNS